MADIGIKISATDAASGVFKSVATEAGKLQGAIGSISSSLGAFTTTAIAGLSVLSFASQIKQAIDLADSFNKLSQKTGVAVDELSKLNYAAGLADVGTDALATGLKKLNINIAAAASGSKEQAALFQSLGISIKDAQGNALSADKVFAQLSDRFADSADGANKTAVAVALLGKNGADLVPLLNGGSQALKDLGDEATKLGIVLGPDFAKKAEDFNDNLHKISLAGQGLAVSLGDNLVSLLGEMSSEMAKAAVESGKLAAVWAGFETFWYGPKLLQANKLMLEQTEKLTSAETELANARASGNANAIRWQQTRVDWLKTEIAKTTELRNTLEADKTKKTASAAAAPTQDSAAIKAAAAALHTTAKAVSTLDDAFVAGRTAAKDWAKSFEDFRKIAAEAAAEVGGLSKAEALRLTYLNSNGYLNASEPMRQLALAEADAAINAEKLAKATKLSAKEALEAVNSYADSVEAQQKAADTLREQVVAEREHVAAIGLSVEAIAELVAAKYEDQAVSKDNLATLADTVDATGTMGAAYRQQAKDLRELAALKRSGALKETIVEANKKIDEENKRTAEKLESAITDGLMRGFENGKSIAENFRDTVENMFRTMVLRPVVQATVNTGLQALGIPGVGGAGGGAGGLLNSASNLNSLYNNATSLFGGGTSSAFGFAGLAGAGTAAGATAALPLVTLADVGAGITATGGSLFSIATPAAAGLTLPSFGASLGATGAATAVGSTVAATSAAAPAAAAIPGIGWAIGGLALLAGLLGGSGGHYVQSTGETKIGFESNGKERFKDAYRFGGESENASADAFAIQLNKTYLSAAKNLGITAAASEFAFGGNDAESSTGKGKFRLGAGVVGGKSYFDSGEIAKSDEAVNLAASRAVLTALSDSALPKYLAGVFDGMATPSTQSQAQIDAVLQTAQAFKTLHDNLLLLPFDTLKDLSFSAAKGLLEFSGGLDKFQANLGAYYDNFYSAEEKKSQALKNITATLNAAGAGVTAEQVGGATRAQFRSIAEGLDVTTDAGQKLYAAMLSVSSAFASITPSVQDATAALQQQMAAQKSAQDAATKAAIDANNAARAALLGNATNTAQDAFGTLSRSVAAQKAQEAAANEAQRAIATAAFTSQSEVYQQQIDKTRQSLDGVTGSVGKLHSLSESLKSTLDGMRIAGSEGAYRADAQAQISAAVATARAGGGLPVDGQLASALSTVSKPSEQLFGSFVDYARDFYKTANDIAALGDLTNAQLSADEVTQGILQDQITKIDEQKKALKDGFADQVSALDDILANAQLQLDAANGLNVSVLSVADALKGFASAISALESTRAGQGLATTVNAATSAVADQRQGTILQYLQGIAGNTQLSDFEKAQTVYTRAQIEGVTEAEIAKAWGSSAEDTRRWFGNAGIPQFDVGTNYVPHDMFAKIHEGEAIVPKAYNPAAGGQGAGNARLEALVEQLTAEVAELRAAQERGNTFADRTARILDGQQGVPLLVEIAA